MMIPCQIFDVGDRMQQQRSRDDEVNGDRCGESQAELPRQSPDVAPIPSVPSRTSLFTSSTTERLPELETDQSNQHVDHQIL